MFLCVLFWTVNLYSQGQSDTPTLPPGVVDCSRPKSDQPCGLPVIQTKDIYSGLQASIRNLGPQEWGFPLDIVTATYGISNTHRSPLMRRLWPWPSPKSRLEKTLQDIKRYRPQPSPQSPDFIALDIPDIGPQSYDPYFVRALINTPLFPYEMEIISTDHQGLKVDYVKLNPDRAQEASDCFKTALSSSIPRCSSPTKTASIFSSNALYEPVALVTRYLPPSPPANTTSVNTEGQASGSEDPKYSWLPRLPVYDEYVELSFKRPCVPYSLLSVNDKEEARRVFANITNPEVQREFATVQNQICRLDVPITIPAETERVYHEIYVQGEVSDPKLAVDNKCDPDDFDRLRSNLTPSEHDLAKLDCTFPGFSWSISGQALTEKRQTRKVPKTFIQLSDGAKGPPQVWLALRGRRNGLGMSPEVQCFCTPVACNQAELNKCQKAK